MKFSDALSLSTRMFKTRPLRTFLTVLGVSVGIGTVFFLVSLGYGLQNVILGQITTADSLLSLDVNPGTSNLLELATENVTKISALPNVTQVARMASLSGQVTIDDTTGDSVIYAIDPPFLQFDGVVPSTGSYDPNDIHAAIISRAGAKLFNLTPQEIVGKKIKLTIYKTVTNQDGLEEVTVVEYPDISTITGVVDNDEASFVYVPLEIFNNLNIDKFSRLKVRVTGNDVMRQVRDAIIDQGFIVSSLTDTIDQINKIFNIVQIILLTFGVIALVVSAIGMFNTMTVTLLERTNEVGIMRAIGITRRDLKKIFLAESVVMGFLGGIGGLIIGFLGGKLINFGINLLAKSLGGKAFDIFAAPTWFVGIIIIFSIVVGFLTGIYPSIKASRMNPLDALRYK